MGLGKIVNGKQTAITPCAGSWADTVHPKPTITIRMDGGSYGKKSGYNYWSAYHSDGRKIDFAQVAGNEKEMRKIVSKWYPDAVVVVGE